MSKFFSKAAWIIYAVLLAAFIYGRAAQQYHLNQNHSTGPIGLQPAPAMGK